MFYYNNDNNSRNNKNSSSNSYGVPRSGEPQKVVGALPDVDCVLGYDAGKATVDCSRGVPMIGWLHGSGMSGWRNKSWPSEPLLLLPSALVLSTLRPGMEP